MKYLLNALLIFFFMACLNTYAFAEETLIIFDASVSMNDNFYGKPKYMAAIDEAKKVIASLPASKPVGLRTIGIKLDASALNYIQDPSLMCKATKLDVPIIKNSSSYISNTLDGIFPLGTTPLEYALRTSVSNDFTKGNELKHIILITDGGENCDGDPCKYIRELMQTRKDIKIDIIAISLNADDFKQLKCITDYSGGTLINVKNPSELSSAFNTAFKETSRAGNSLNTNPDYNNYNNRYNPAINEAIQYKNFLFETYD